MSQHTGPVDDEGIELTYSSLPTRQRSSTPFAGLPRDEESEPAPVQASRGAWPHSYRRMLNVASLGALFLLGVLLGTVVSGYAASPRSASLPPRPSQYTLPTTTPLDARFAIVTLGVECLRETCDGSRYVPAGQPVYALQAGASCTTTTPVEVVGRRLQYVYCRLDQPNVFTAAFDGAPLLCVGSRLGCHFVLRVETTNGR